MKMTKARIEQANIVGQVHSEAWKQAYAEAIEVLKKYMTEEAFWKLVRMGVE